jgi:outer membrane protein assembly factor BamD (BamD/ComL family)
MENDPLYLQGLRHFGQGEWSEAVACFSQLQVNYPADPRVAQFLESARLRAAMGSGLQRGARTQARSTALQRFSRLGVLLVILAIAAAVFLAYQTWAVPAQAESARLARIDQLRQTAQVQIASGQYAEAAQTYQAILAEAPGDAPASAGLERAQQLDQASRLYAQASEALNAGNQAEAMRLLQEINALDPGYRDAASLLDQIKSTQALSAAYDEALQQYQSGDLQGAAQAFESIRATDASFRPNDVGEHLFTAYVDLGNRQIGQADTTAEVEVAGGYYQKALTLRPLDPRADTARRIAEAFLDGAAAYQAKDWDTVIRKLSVVHEQEPAYFGGKVAEWLYEAFITTGDALMAQNDPFTARDRFAEALRLAPSEALRAEAQKRYDQANRLTTPTRTPRPSPTALPSGYVAPSWTRRATGTPDPYPFAHINTTYLPNTITGEGCRWAGVAGRIFDRQGAPLTAPTLGVRVTGPVDQGVAAGAHPIIGESGWIVQFDVRAKIIQGYVQVYYKDRPASALIPFSTRNSCYENMLIIDIQQLKPLP